MKDLPLPRDLHAQARSYAGATKAKYVDSPARRISYLKTCVQSRLPIHKKHKQSLLLQLPPEIRNQIFENVIAGAVSIHAEYSTHRWFERVKDNGLTCLWTPSDTINRSDRKSCTTLRWPSSRYFTYLPFLRKLHVYALFTQLAHRRYCQLGERDRFGAISDFAILRTCRQIHNEARHLPYRLRMFDFYDFGTMLLFFQITEPSCVSNIRRLSIDCYFMEMRFDDETKAWSDFCASVPEMLPHLNELQIFTGKKFPQYYYWRENAEDRLQLKEQCWQSLLTLRKLPLLRVSMVMTNCNEYLEDEVAALHVFVECLKKEFLPMELNVKLQWM